jgi:CubicO group peptidase (beta-lactamase class C family)
MAPAGSLNASIRDLVKWELALSGGTIVKASTLGKMTTPYRLRDGKDGAFGLGFVTSSVGPYATVSYGGGAAAWRLAIPVKHLTVIVLTNLQGSGPETLAAGIAALYEPTVATSPAH